MSFQIFPNWFKKLGLGVFIVSTIFTAGDPFMDGFKGVEEGTHHYFKDFLGQTIYYILNILPTVGLLVYMLSKEKIEDDYLKLLRLSTYQLTVIITLLISFGLYVLSPQIKFSLDMALSLFMLLFLVVFHFKKNQDL
ncbi:hypothetical protein [Croceivirga thetidis]|uniref:Uncharacterized protein n=1 Tax=Croceivirga thetidis TaxID=2721623 RepID=A0ABX1GQY3_9FLAO|nr:hypothetical protein [Croceivirga thetidis]NKI31350.1 hypothetical protein [Croceivirga thetidis]